MSLPASMYRNSSIRVPSSVRSNNNSAAVPSTAPVLDYSCLFSHDLKRKQKRWQDGKLKFHTFNKRIMVYDDRGNFIGDMHWREDYDFDEGEEFQLERGCVIVQVGECLGSKQQDLSELIDKRYQDKEQRQARAAAAAVTTPARAIPRPPPPGAQQRPLSDLTTTPRGNVIGRAVIPTRSPFEQRQAESNGADSENERPAKRRKPEISPPSKSGYAQSLFGAALSLSSWSANSQPSRIVRTQEASQGVVGSSMHPPPSRSRPLPSLLQSVSRDVPFPSAQASAAPRAPKSPPRSVREPSPEPAPRQRQKPSRNSAAVSSAVKTTARSRTLQSPPDPRHSRNVGDAEEDDSEEDIVEIAPPPTTSSTRKKPVKEKRVPRKDDAKKAPQPGNDKPKQRPQKAAPPEKPPAPHTEPVVCDDDDNQERSRLISRPRSSRTRRLLVVAENATAPKRHQGEKEDPGVHNRPPTIPAIPKAAPDIDVEDEFAEGSDKRSSLKSRAPQQTADTDSSTGKDPGRKRSAGRTPPPMDQFEKVVASVQKSAEVHSSPDVVTSTPDDLIGHQSEANDIVVVSDGSPDTSDEDDMPVPAVRRCRQRTTNTETSSIDEDVQERSVNPTRNLWLEKEFPFLPQGARLATLRRSVKSKEILGFVREELDSPQLPSSASQPESPYAESLQSEKSEILMTSESAEETNGLSLSPPAAARESVSVETQRPQDTGMPQKKPVGSSAPGPGLETIPLYAAPAIPCPKEPCPPPLEDERTLLLPPAATVVADSFHGPVAAPGVPAKVRAEEAAEETVCQPQDQGEKVDDSAATMAASPLTRPQPRRPVRSLTTAQATISRKVTSESNQSAGSFTSEEPAAASPDCPAVAAGPAAAKPNNPPFQAQRPRIVNPATRGRKAALSSDAAGQLPQTIVPAALPAPPIMGPPRKAAPKEGQQNRGASETVVLPGFTRAGGGAWSKTAFDLLGMERPTT